MLFWTRRTYCFLLCLSSNLAGVLPFRNRALGGVSAAESPTVLDGKASIPHPSISLQLFAISWFEGAERPPVLKPMRHRLGMNLAGVRNRALGGVSAAASPTVLDGKASIPHPSISLQLFAFSWFEGAERPPVLKPIRRPLGMNLAGVLPFRIRAVGRVSAAESPTVLDGKASTPYPIHPSLSNSLLLAGSKVLKGPFKRLSRLGCAMFLVDAVGLVSSSYFFFLLVGSKGAVLDPPNVLFFAVPELESCWGSAVSEPCPRRCFCSRISYTVLDGKASSFYTPSIHLSPTLCFELVRRC